MSAATAAPPAAGRSHALRQLTITEMKLFAREPLLLFWAVPFPIALLVVFGFIPAFRTHQAAFGGNTLFDAYVPVLILFSMALLALISMPITLATYREHRVLRRLQTTPAGPARVLGAQLLVSSTVAVAESALILAVARLHYGTFLPRQLAGFALAFVFALAALLALGMFVAAIGPSGRGAYVIGALLFYPMLFFSGLWWPIPQMPPALQHISEATPLGAAWQAMTTAAVGHWPHPQPLLTLAAYAVVFGLVAVRAFRWE
jgi:ABC-2 type transport system permease protein